ncbi:MAG TPA: PQQ-binding-like beta-propeller repeat protein [Gemmataceae bacterium]|nr:PQQ-binding-like beta-propeller repeat protein [Gemmataceae bacterium]
MKRLAAAALTVVLTAGAAAAQTPRWQIFSRPSPPPREALDRLNLKMAWRVFVPVGERRDGIATVQIDGNDMFVQTRSGLIVRLDAETGVTYWRARVGNPFQVFRLLAINRRAVYAVNSTFVYALDRATGAVQWQYRVVGGLSASPVADDNLLFLSTPNGRLQAFYLPRPETAVVATAIARERAGVAEPGAGQRPPDLYANSRRMSASFGTGTVREASTPEEVGLQPIKVWDYVSGLRLEFAPLQTRDYVLAVSPTGAAVAVPKVPQEGVPIGDSFRFAANGVLDALPGQFLDTAFIGSHDFNLYALNINTGRLDWRYTAGGPVSRRPVALNEDVYLTSEGNGMARLDRASGQPLWRVPRGNRVLESNPEADRFLAANPKFVYAADASGRLLVLDRQRGHRLSSYDTHTFYVPITNQVTDRVYLAANNGLIVCLHDKEYATPYRQRRAEEEQSNPTLTLMGKPITDPGSRPTALRDLMEDVKKKYKFNYLIAERAFKDAGRDAPGGQLVQFPTVKEVPLGEALNQMLKPIGATYEVISDTVVIIPGAPAPAPAPAPLPPKQPAPPPKAP